MASMYGGLLGGINQTNKTLTSIVTVSDGFTTMSGGDITGVQNISTSNLTITGDLIAPELITSSIITPTGTLNIGNSTTTTHIYGNLITPTITTSNIQTVTGALLIGSQNDDIQIIGSNIRLIGNVVGYDSANVYIVDKAIDLNASGFGNATLDGAGINVLGDGNIVISSILTNNVGDWIFSNPNNNRVVIGNLEVANLSVTNPIVYENFESSNITATNKFFSPERIITDRSVYRSSAISHLNAGDIKCTRMSFVNQTPFRIESGYIGTALSSGTITFSKPFIDIPAVILTATRNSTGATIAYTRTLSNTEFIWNSRDNNGTVVNCFLSWMAIGY